MNSKNQEDAIFQMATSFVNQTSCNIFLTGKAGSGKTTFLQNITKLGVKNNVVVAPTGVAAINAGGVTIHSFFQLPIGIYVPETWQPEFQHFAQAVYTPSTLLKKIRINKQKRKLMQQLELLIIDEVSMVRADIMDAVDMVLRFIRKNYKQAFGGVQILLIGDLYQLPPVVPEQDKQLISRYYDSPYFFSARVIQKSPPVILELKKIFRQKDKEFLDLLSKIRHNQISETDLKRLNSSYNPNFKPPASENYITLCSHHYKANVINERELKQLPGRLYQFNASVEGEFNESAAPTDKTLFLKKGAQIMFIKNDTGEKKRYYNGKIGLISEIDEEEITVYFPEDKRTIFLEKEAWRNIRYTYDNTTNSIIEKELGTFHQYPIRLAWAITIHKSQGLTFRHAIVDAGDSFTSGQVYVALSRLKSMDGLILLTPIQKESILNDLEVQDQLIPQNQIQLQALLELEQKNFLTTILLNSMNWEAFINKFREFADEYKEKQISHREEAIQMVNDCIEKGEELKNVARKFHKQVSKLLAAGNKEFPLLSERMQAAYLYFSRNLKDGIEIKISEHYKQMRKRTRMRKYLQALQGLEQAVMLKTREIKQARDLTMGLKKGEKISTLLSNFNEQQKKLTLEPKNNIVPKKPQRGDSRKISFEMYQQGKSIEKIAFERMLSPGTIESHLLYFISEGRLDVHALVSKEKYDCLLPKLIERSTETLSKIKSQLGNKYTYNEIRAVLNQINHMNKSKS